LIRVPLHSRLLGDRADGAPRRRRLV